MKRLLVASLAVLIAVTGCSGPAPDPKGAEVVPVSTTQAVYPAPVEDLVGMWRVSDVDGESVDTWVRFADELVVWNDCGVNSGTWRPSDGLFVALLDTWYDGSCAELEDRPSDWLVRASGYGYIDGKLSLIGNDGERLASLTEGGLPPNGLIDVEEYRNDPTLEDLQYSLETEVPPLPSEATPVETLVGRWVPAAYEGDDQPYFDVRADGSYVTHEGCGGGEGGHWSVNPGGRMLTATYSAVPAIACVRIDGKPEPEPTFVLRAPLAALVGMVGNELTFYNSEGKKVGALLRG